MQHSSLHQWKNSKDGKYITNKQRQSFGQPPKVSVKKNFQANISTIEAQLKVVEEGPTKKEIEACFASAKLVKPSATKNTMVNIKYKDQVLAVR